MPSYLGTDALELFDQSGNYFTWLYQQFSSHIGRRIMEVGAGRGHLTQCYINQVDNACLTELDAECFDYLRSTYNHNGRISMSSVDLINPPFNNSFKEKFDTVLSSNVIEHLEDDSPAIHWMNFMLEPRGKLILVLPAHQFLFGAIDKYYGHYRRYDKSSLRRKLEKRDFRLIDSFYFGKVGAIGWFIKGRLLGQGKIDSRVVATKNFLLPLSKIVEKAIPLPFGHNIITIAEKI